MYQKNDISYHLTFVIWGKTYADRFLELILPSYLAPANIPVCSQKHRLIVYIYTSERESRYLQEDPRIQKLKEYVSVEFLEVITEDLLNGKNKWGVKGYCQSLGIKKAIEEGAVVLLLNPDALISNGSLKNCLNRVEEGKKVILIAELARIESESLALDLKDYYDPKSLSLSLSARAVVRLGLKNFHPMGRVAFWDEKTMSQWPSYFYWQAGENNLLAKFFHLHPMAIDTRSVTRRLPEVLMPDDGGLIEFLKISPKDVYVVTNSEEIVALEVSSKFMDPLMVVSSSSKQRVLPFLAWTAQATTFLDRCRFKQYNLRFQGDDNFSWTEIENRAAKNLAVFYFILKLVNLYHLMRYPDKFLFRVLRFLQKKNL